MSSWKILNTQQILTPHANKYGWSHGDVERIKSYIFFQDFRLTPKNMNLLAATDFFILFCFVCFFRNCSWHFQDKYIQEKEEKLLGLQLNTDSNSNAWNDPL